MKNWFKSNWVFLLIVLVAAMFRYWQIHTLPGGLFPDEAAYGMDARSITRGDIQPFYERGNGREGLFMYFLALGIALFGYAPWVNHVISASFGLAAVIATYFLTRQIFDKQTANLATFLFAISSYAVTMTRTGFRANTIPLFVTLTLLFSLKAFFDTDSKSRIRSAVIAGLSFGLGFYTYISFRMMPPLLFGFAVILLFAYRDRFVTVFSEYKKQMLAFSLAFIIAFAWIGFYWFIAHPGSFIGRAGQVSVFSPDLNQGDLVGTIIDVVKKTLISFFADGDLNWRHNVSGYAFLTPLISPFFALALIAFSWQMILLLKQAWQKNISKETILRALLAAWFWLMLVPEITTAEGIPHGLRLIGTIPVIFILSAAGIMWFWRKISAHEYFERSRTLFAVIFIATLFIYNFNLYFGKAAQSFEYQYAFRSDLTEVSKYINQRNNKNQTYLSLDAFSVQTVDYLTTPTNQPYILLVPENSWMQPLSPGDQIIFTQSTIFDAQKFQQTHPSANIVKYQYNKFRQLIMVVMEQ